MLNAVTADGGATWKAATQTWAPATIYARGTLMYPGNGLVYRASVGGYSGSSAPDWPSSGDVADGQVTWVALTGWATAVGGLTYDGTCVWEAWEAYWLPSTAYAEGNTVEPWNGYQYGCTSAGTSAATEPIWPAGIAEFDDGTVGWTRTTLGDGEGYDISEYGVEATISDWLRKWDARADQVLAAGGVEPSFSSATASSMDAGSELWRDVGHTWWWVAEGADYLPIFSNTEYVSCRRRADGMIESTQEFSIAIRVGACATLADGDNVTITMGDARWGNTYLVGDTLHLTTIAGAPLACTGGADADAVQTWAVSGSVDGALDPYSCDPAAPALYSDGGVAFRLNQGGIPYTAGDLWQFGVEAGTYKYRVGVGAWSADTDIGPKSLSSGLALAFTDGVSPSFVSGDTAAFSVAQPYAADHRGPALRRRPCPDADR